MNNTTNAYQTNMHVMNTALTAEEINHAYRELMKAMHPDNISTEADIDLLTRANECRQRNLARLSNRLEQWEREQKQNRERQKAIRHDFKTVDELLSCGLEMVSVIEGTVKKVSAVFSGKTPKANKKQITDKHHADAYGNMDGIRSYPWATVILNKNYTINHDVMESVIQDTVVQILENKEKEEYADLPVSVLVWISARQAMYNYYRNEVKKPSMLQTVSIHEAYEASEAVKDYLIEKAHKKEDVFNLSAYQTEVSNFWTTETTAVTRVYIEELTRNPFERKVLALSEAGYTQEETGKAFGVSQKTISNVIERVHNRLLCDRMTAYLDSMEEIRRKNGQKRNASEKAMLKSLIMRSIKNGMSYQRIAYHLHIAEFTNDSGKTVTIREQINTLLTA